MLGFRVCLQVTSPNTVDSDGVPPPLLPALHPRRTAETGAIAERMEGGMADIMGSKMQDPAEFN